MKNNYQKHVVIGITGASGSIYAKSIINKLIDNKRIKLSLVISDEAKKVCAYELGEDFLDNLSIRKYCNNDFFAEFASGSSAPDALIVIPCTAGTMGRIANGTSDNLICRTADVVLKERKKLILVLREMPYNLIHIKNMETITLSGGIICPASPSFYSKPENINDLVDTVINRVLDLCDIENSSYRWGK
jgi:flavin prenyltransferase